MFVDVLRDYGLAGESRSTRLPQGSKDPNIRVLGPKYYNMNGIWALKPHYSGPWTLNPKPNISP